MPLALLASTSSLTTHPMKSIVQASFHTRSVLSKRSRQTKILTFTEIPTVPYVVSHAPYVTDQQLKHTQKIYSFVCMERMRFIC